MELSRVYLALTRDLIRVMSRLKAVYRSWAIPCADQQVYVPRHRAEWLAKITEAGVRRRAEFYSLQFDGEYPLPPVAGEVFPLTLPFIDRGHRKSKTVGR
jgi:hypothetical protein